MLFFSKALTLSTSDLAPRQLVSFLTTASNVKDLISLKNSVSLGIKSRNWMSAMICRATEVSEKTVLAICLQSLWPEDHLSDSVMWFDFHVCEFPFFSTSTTVIVHQAKSSSRSPESSKKN